MPPTIMAMKLGIRSPVPIVGSRPNCPAASTPLRAGKKDPDGEIERTKHLHINAECCDRFEVERAGADTHAETGVAEKQKEKRNGDHHHGHHEQAITGDEEQVVAQRLAPKTAEW